MNRKEWHKWLDRILDSEPNSHQNRWGKQEERMAEKPGNPRSPIGEQLELNEQLRMRDSSGHVVEGVHREAVENVASILDAVGRQSTTVN